MPKQIPLQSCHQQAFQNLHSADTESVTDSIHTNFAYAMTSAYTWSAYSHHSDFTECLHAILLWEQPC